MSQRATARSIDAPFRAPGETADQLALELRTELPRLAIEADWKDQARLWGHPLHPMCSYLASFPAALAHAFIARYSRPGDVVFDPFSGRGTTPLQAAAEGRIGVGNDLNPFAHLLTAAKVQPATPAEARTRLTRLRLAWSGVAQGWERRAVAIQASPGTPDGAPAEVAIAFHPRTFAQLLYLREALDLNDRVDRFLAAAITGILHGKSASYLSELMPNTFSMAPRYVRDFAARTAYAAPDRDVFACLGAKLDRLYRAPLPPGAGIALLGDARDAAGRARTALRARGLPDRARLVVTSPPYLRVVKYGYYNWLRAWFLGEDPRAIDAALDDAHHRAPYLDFMREVLHATRPILADDAIVVLVIGDVATDRGRAIRSGTHLAEQVWAAAAAPEGYRLAGVALDEVQANRKMTKLWGEEAGRATQLDRILVLGASEAGRRRALSGAATPVDWTWPQRLRAL
ncbi:MAG: DNA methyltransferase [Candidatus Limnocylindrales bacterium]